MIVKNERHVIERCLNSVRPYITSYQICDTGSTDGTPDLIRELLAQLHGEVTSHPWVDFSYNRNQAIDLARGKSDYLLTIDADETVQGKLEDFDADCLYTPTLDVASAEKYLRPRIFRNDGSCKYVGKIHEALVPLGNSKTAVSQSPLFMSYYDSHRNQLGDKFQRDLRVLMMEPPTCRNLFYLAQTYFGLNRYEDAIQTYKMRIDKKGWDEEVYFSMHQIGRCLLCMDLVDDALGQFFRAYTFRPQRYESLLEICKILTSRNQLPLALSLCPDTFIEPKDTLFVNVNSHWRIIEMKGALLAANGKTDLAKDIYQQVKLRGVNTKEDIVRLEQCLLCLANNYQQSM